MSEAKKSGCMKAFMVFVVVNVVLTLVVSAVLFVIWKKQGSPAMADLKARLQAQAMAASAGEDAGESVIAGLEAGEGSGIQNVVLKRPVVATAPISAGADTYARYVKRTDVLTLVNYYSDT